MAENQKVEDLAFKELMSLVKLYRTKQDVAMPSKRNDLIQKYRLWKNQPTPLFNDAGSGETGKCYINKNNSNDDIGLSNVALI